MTRTKKGNNKRKGTKTKKRKTHGGRNETPNLPQNPRPIPVPNPIPINNEYINSEIRLMKSYNECAKVRAIIFTKLASAYEDIYNIIKDRVDTTDELSDNENIQLYMNVLSNTKNQSKSDADMANELVQRFEIALAAGDVDGDEAGEIGDKVEEIREGFELSATIEKQFRENDNGFIIDLVGEYAPG